MRNKKLKKMRQITLTFKRMKFDIFLLTAVFMILSSCSVKQEDTAVSEKTPMVICFDVEDYTSPESVGMDDIPKWLADIMMTEEGVTGTLKMQPGKGG